MSVFSKVRRVPIDPIFALNAEYLADTHEKKVNVGIGAYRDDDGNPWVLPVVRRVESELATANLDHEYLPIDGLAEFREAGAALVLGKALPHCAVQTLSGTGAIRLCAEFLQREVSDLKRVLVSEPSWPMHRTIFEQTGFAVTTYPYLVDNKLNLSGTLAALEAAPGSVVVLHACAHNPTGTDPTRAQWEVLLAAVDRLNITAVFDLAYQGFATGDPDADAWPVRRFAEFGKPFFVAQSCAKNFGLYNERCGLLLFVANDTAAVHSQLVRIQRSLVSNPPAHGARIVAKILRSPALLAEWRASLLLMTARIASMRKALRDKLVQLKTPGNWDHIVQQIGMFSYTGLTESQSEAMKEFHIYMSKSGRISLAGLNSRNIEYFAESVDFVVRNK